MVTMVNGFSDSQESEILDEATYRQLQNELQNEPIYPLLNEDIMENEQKCQMVFAPEQNSNIPVLDEFAGPYNFQMILNNQGAGKHCVYSETLQKIFINMEQTLPLRFEWQPPLQGFFVRTTMVFSLDQYRSDPVLRCHNHMATNNATGPIKHVVRCLHPASLYSDSPDPSSHLWILTPLGKPQAGSDYVPMNFQFFCKNSCTSGMNRRPTELVFTLENQSCEVLGRRRLPVRVCSCPKRDKEKEEAEHRDGSVHVGGGKKRKLNAPAGKKLSTPGVTDTREYVVNFKIQGRENYHAVLKHALGLLASEEILTGHHERLRPYMNDLLDKMK